MSRLYELYDSLQTVTIIRRDANDKKTQEFVTALEKVNKEELLRALNYLYPLVKAIDFCQKDTTSSMEVIPLLRNIYSYYTNNIMITLDSDLQKKIFDERFRLFRHLPEELFTLFTETPREVNTSSKEIQERVKRIRQEAFNVFASKSDFDHTDFSMKESADIRANKVAAEVNTFLNDWKSRIGITTTQYFQFSSCNCPQLYSLWKLTMSRVASSATVERSFSAQALLQTPLRNSLSIESVNELLSIRLNYKSLTAIKGKRFVTRWLECYDGLKEKGELCIPPFM